jgi:hypothetical protein
VQVPHLVDLVGRRDRVPGDHGEKDETLVFADHAFGMHVRPLVLPREPVGEREGAVTLVERKGLDAIEQVLMLREQRPSCLAGHGKEFYIPGREIDHLPSPPYRVHCRQRFQVLGQLGRSDGIAAIP